MQCHSLASQKSSPARRGESWPRASNAGWKTSNIKTDLLCKKKILHEKLAFPFRVTRPELFKLTRRVQAATRQDLLSYWSSVKYQVTNYGLAGLCEPHVDPHGYLEGAELPPSRRDLVHSGDIWATFMGYLEDVPAGGATTFLVPGFARMAFYLHHSGFLYRQGNHCLAAKRFGRLLDQPESRWPARFEDIARRLSSLEGHKVDLEQVELLLRPISRLSLQFDGK